jgi:ferredoxin
MIAGDNSIPATLDAVSSEPAASVRVRTHPGLCEGWGNCHRFAPAVYPLDADGHIGVHLVEVPPELADDAYIGATTCPEHAITIVRSARSASRPT